MSTTTPLPPGILDALQGAAGGASPDGRTFEQVSPEVTLDDGSNKHDLLCPRGCRSVILKRGVGRLVERSGIEMDSPNELSPAATVQWWRVGPSPMAFENVGFSRPVTNARVSSRSVKYLVCADCDVGPLGWCEEGGTEYLLACVRVKYGGVAG